MSLRQTRLVLAAVLTAGALVLASCASNSETPDPSGSPDATSSPAAADPDATLTVGLVLEPSNLDIRRTSGAAIEQVLVNNIYEGLVMRTEDNTITERLASSYEISEDGLTYTFVLNDGITFHSGEALTSADVVASFEEVRTDAGLQGHDSFAKVASIQAPDAATVVITLTEPDQNFLFALTSPAGLVFRAGDTTDLQTAANGTGPFTLTSWKQGSSLTFSRNDAYWGTPSGVAEVLFQYIPDFTAGVNAAISGDLDVLTAVDPQLVSQLEDTGEFVITRGATTDKGTLAFNNQREPLNDPRVRKALRLAIDHKALVEAIGSGTTLYGPIPELDPGYEDLSDVAPYDPNQAKALLAEAGQENLELTLTIPSLYGTTIPQVLISDFNAIGVTLDVDSVDFATWTEDVYKNKDYDLSYVLHVEPRDFANFANPDYYFGYDNPEVQDLYAQALSETDEEKSAELLAKAARIVSEDDAADWIYNNETITAHIPEVSGFPTASVNSQLDLVGVTVAAD